MRLALVCLALAAGCYSPSIDDGQYTCPNADSVCPDGFTCDSECKACVRPESLGKHVGCVEKIACSNGTMRSAGTPEQVDLPKAAFCPAAWLVPGVNTTATPCKRQPGVNGVDGNNTKCSIEDNCAAGWHVCNNEADLGSHEVLKSVCLAVDKRSNEAAFWATRVQGNTCGGVSGAFGDAVFGCGNIGDSVSMCDPVQRALVRHGNSCSGVSVWECGGITSSLSDSITKTSASSEGGVICCHD